ncbi:MAG: immunoglobulin domain-containing protein [Bacteroidota bacterium]
MKIRAAVVVAITLLSFSAKAEKIFIANGDVAALVAAINQANQNNRPDTIILALRGKYIFKDPIVSFYDGNSALPDVILDQAFVNKIVVYGNGSTLERDATAPPFRIWMIFGGSLELHDVVIKNGKLNGNPGQNGAGIHNLGELFIYNSTFVNNSASFLGGAMYIGVSSPTVLTNCTITGNSATSGSAIYFYSGSASITSCTIVANNSTTGNGSGLDNALTLDDPNRRVYIKNNIIALNVNNSGIQNDVTGVLVSYGRNLVGVNKDPNAQTYLPSGIPNYIQDYVGTAAAPVDPLVNALADNGGLTPTISIQQSSLAFNNGGQASSVTATDQAGNNRIGNAEIGSLEFNNNPILSPGIAVVQGATNIVQAGQFAFGDVIMGNTSGIKQFKIRNTGFSLALNLISNPRIFLTGPNTNDFTLGQTSTSSSVGGNGETSFNVTFNPKTLGSKSVTISIASNDTSNPIFSFQLIGNSITVPPVIDTGIAVSAVSPICVGTTGTVTLKSSESGIEYQVFKGIVAVSAVITGGGDLMIPVSSQNLSVGNNQLKVLGVKPGVGGDTLTMKPMIRVDPSTAIILQPGNQSKCEGLSSVFSITAVGTGLTYQWRNNATDVTDGPNISGATSTTLILSDLTAPDAGNYNCVVSGTCGAQAISATATLSVGNAPTISRQPTGDVKGVGQSITFSLAAGGSSLTYQWRKGTTSLTDNTKISGATSDVLTISGLLVDDAGDYNCVVSSSCGSIVSNDAVLVINKVIPAITFTSIKTTGDIGEELTISAASESPVTIDFTITDGSGQGVFLSPGELLLKEPGTIEVTATQAATTDYDAATAKQIITVTTVVTGIEDPGASLMMYPNPTTGIVMIESDGADKILLIDMKGFIVKEWDTGRSKSLDVKEVSAGIYLLAWIRRSQVVLTRRLIKE